MNAESTWSYSRPLGIRPSFIWNLDYPELKTTVEYLSVDVRFIRVF